MVLQYTKSSLVSVLVAQIMIALFFGFSDVAKQSKYCCHLNFGVPKLV